MKYHLVTYSVFVDTLFMNKKNNSRKLTRDNFAVIAFGFVSSLAGSLASLAGNLAVTIGTAFAVGLVCLIYFLFFTKSKSSTSSESLVAENTGDNTLIPSDRIDPLTGLANENGLSAWFSEKSEKLIADGKSIIVLVADLADFAQIERSHGKAISDSVLIEVAKRVASCTGADGIAARNSGDQFAAVATVVPSNSAEVAADQAGKLTELLQRPVELPTGVIWIGGSVGAAYGSPRDGAAVLAKAREALKKAERVGRGHYVVDTIQES